MNEAPALLLGYGSIGRRHARFLNEQTPSLVIVETNQAAREAAQHDHPAARVVEQLAYLDGELDWPSAVAVVATWGPSHATLFHQLIDRGVRRVVCEKPVAHGAALAWGMAKRAQQTGIALAVNHYFRYAGAVAALRALFAQHQLGEPVAIVIEGGAACLVTNGIHWIDFACELFGDAPQAVISTAESAPINPRSPELGFYGGTAIFSFSGGREATISFNNQSSVAPLATIYLRNALIRMDSDFHVRTLRRDPAAVARFPAVTRTGTAEELLFAGILPDTLSFEQRSRALLRDVWSNGELICSGVVGAAAVEYCIGTLVAGRERRAITFPLEASWAQEEWPIS